MKLDQASVMAAQPCQPTCTIGCDFASFFFRRVEVVSKELVHGEHVHFVLLEDGVHGLVASDLTLVGGILKITFLDIRPDLLYCLRSRQSGLAKHG
jgi:hypothetical protein